MEMLNDEQLIIRLRDCFIGGYTLPQFCIDNKINRPLFVAEKKFAQFMWEIYVQFRYDKRLIAQFSLIDFPNGQLNNTLCDILSPLEFKNLAELTVADCDAIICLTAKKIFPPDKVTYLDALLDYFVRKTYCEIPLLNFLQRHSKIKLILTNFPRIILNENSTERERQLCQDTIRQVREKVRKRIPTPYDFPDYTNQEIYELLELSDAKVNPDGTTSLKINTNPLVGIPYGKRITMNQPEKFLNRIYFMGTCTFFGIGAPFNKTIESYLQQLLNEHNLPYRVENESQFFARRYQDIFYNLNDLPVKPGDIVIICLQDLLPLTLPFFDISNIFDKPADRIKVFTNSCHVNEFGYKRIAEKFFNLLTENNFFRDTEFNYHMPPPPITDTVYLRNSSRAA